MDKLEEHAQKNFEESFLTQQKVPVNNGKENRQINKKKSVGKLKSKKGTMIHAATSHQKKGGPTIQTISKA